MKACAPLSVFNEFVRSTGADRPPPSPAETYCAEAVRDELARNRGVLGEYMVTDEDREKAERDASS